VHVNAVERSRLVPVIDRVMAKAQELVQRAMEAVRQVQRDQQQERGFELEQ
jgi:hypothetical protein